MDKYRRKSQHFPVGKVFHYKDCSYQEVLQWIRENNIDFRLHVIFCKNEYTKEKMEEINVELECFKGCRSVKNGDYLIAYDNDLNDIVSEEEFKKYYEKYESTVEEVLKEKKEISMCDLSIPVRTLNRLRMGGLDSVQEIAATTQRELLKITDIGPLSLKEIVIAFKEIGIDIPK